MWNHFVCLMVVTVSFAVSAGAQDLASCKQTDEILTELRELRALVDKLVSAQSQTQSASGTAQPQISTALTQIAVGNNPFLGSKDASLTIVEFTDFQCPYCNQFFVQTFPQLKENYIDSGKVRFYSVDFPLNIHENALQAAQAGRCAADEEKFWLMHDRMQRNPNNLDLAKLVDYAKESGLDVMAFRKCLEDGKYKEVRGCT